MRPAALTALLGVFLLLAAAAFDGEPLYVAGLAFLLAGLLSVGWVLLGGAGVRIERELAARTVLEDAPVEVRLRVLAGVLPLGTGAVEEALLAAPVPLLLGRREMTVRISASFARRGRRVLDAPAVVVRDPLGLAARTVARADPAEVLVLPRVLPVATVGGASRGGILSPRAGRPRIAAEVELDGIRPYRPGAGASRIHWSVFARTGELYERRLTADADARPLVVLDPRTGADEDGARDRLDAAVRAAASLVVALAREGGCSLLLPGDRRPGSIEPALVSWPRAHARLALIEDQDLGPSLSGLGARTGPLVYVTATPGPRPPRALLSGSGLRILVTPGPQPGRRTLFTVAGCTGAALADDRRQVA